MLLWQWTVPPFNSLKPGDAYAPDNWVQGMDWCWTGAKPLTESGTNLGRVWIRIQEFLAATKQLYDWFSLSVRPSVCPSVRHTFFTMFPSSYHHEIFRSYYQWQRWRPCKRSRSKVKVTEVNTQLNRFRTVTLVWIHIYDDEMMHMSNSHRKRPPQIWCWHPLHFANTNLKGTKIASSCAIPHKEIIRHNTIFQILFFFQYLEFI